MATPKLTSRVKTSGLARLGKRLGAGGQFLVTAGGWLLGPNRATVPDDAVSFQSDIDEIVEERPPRFMRSSLYIVVALVLSLIVVATVNKVEVVVVSSGRLIPDTPPIVLQPMDRSIIRDIRVKTGAMVTKGQILAVLDSTFTQADLAALTLQRRSLQDQIHGLEAELETLAPDVSAVPDLPETMLPLYRQRRAQYKSRLRVFDEDLLRLQANMHSTEDDRMSLAKQLDISRDVEQMRAALSQSQAGSKLQYMDAQSFRMRSERDFQNTVNHLVELQHDLQAKQAERQSFIDEWRRQSLENLVNAQTELAKINEQITKAKLVNDLVVITSPEDGMLLDVAQLSVGSIVGGGERLMTIMPSKTNLVAEIMLSSRDIGYVRAGDEAVVKVDAFPYQRHGFLRGKLLWVSEESFSAGGASGGATPQEGGLMMSGRSAGAVHRGWLGFADIKLDNLPKGARLIPGMTLSADIKVGSRSIMSYILSPIGRAFSESIREP